jgi:chromosome segregation ATPase
MKNLKDQLSSLKDELKSDFKKTLTKEESDRLDSLTKSLDKYRKEYSDASIERLNLETQRQSLEQEIRTTLYPRRDQLKSRSVDDDDNQLNERRKELEILNKALSDILARQKTTEHEVEKIAKSMRENQAKLTDLQVPLNLTFSNIRLRTQRLLVRLSGIRRLLSRAWRNVLICSINATSVIKVSEISESCLKKRTRNTRMQTLQRYNHLYRYTNEPAPEEASQSSGGLEEV